MSYEPVGQGEKTSEHVIFYQAGKRPRIVHRSRRLSNLSRYEANGFTVIDWEKRAPSTQVSMRYSAYRRFLVDAGTEPPTVEDLNRRFPGKHVILVPFDPHNLAHVVLLDDRLNQPPPAIPVGEED